jgi:diadenosine tetraphosphate (Ap4A) HIT family hydrolase/predicted GNAT family N-acyltransferase
MLIRALTKNDVPAWLALAHESDEIVSGLIPDIATFYKGFDDYMESKIKQHEAFMAADRISGKCLGVVTFSKNNSRITFLAVTKEADFQKIGGKLIEVALNQLDNTREITVNVLKSDAEPIKQERALYERFSFVESDNAIVENGIPAIQMKRPSVAVYRPGSFHHNFANYIDWQDEQKCPICVYGEIGALDTVVIKELEYSRVEASMLAAQGLLWGKCVVVCKKHYVELHEMPSQDLLGYMTDVQKVARALKEVSGAVKINLEMHGNTKPHLHTHLFPRYLDDLYAGQSIDYSKISPVPYESKAEYDYFVEQMRRKLSVS